MAQDDLPTIPADGHCNGRLHQRRGYCQLDAGWGTPHVGVGRCKLHGGCSPASVLAGERELVEKEARILFNKLVPDLKPVENPLEEYAKLAAEVLAWKDVIGQLLGDLTGVGYEHEFAGEQIRAAVQVFERALDRCNTVLASYARLRIDERLAEITEKQKLTVVRAIEAALDEIGVADEARADARRRVAKHLRLVPPLAA